VGFGFVAVSAATAASGPSWTDIVTAVGTVLAGLALPLAFIQLGALRQDRLREQVSKVGGWAGAPEQQQMGAEPRIWTIPVFIRNGSGLPVRVDAFDLAARDGRDDPLPPGVSDTSLVPGTIPPEETWRGHFDHSSSGIFDPPRLPMVSVIRIVVTDAAGHQWETLAGRPGPARLVRRRRR
jgi:hypothetical protein